MPEVPGPDQHSIAQATSSTQRFAFWAHLAALLITAEFLRIGAALWIEWRNRPKGVVHEFADSELYWKLALNIASGKPYDDGKRKVLRTPGYPVFLAACIRMFGDSPTAARHTQAALGAVSCALLFALVRRLTDDRTAWIAAWLAVFYPFAVFLSAVLLSESVFTFTLLLQLLFLSRLCDNLFRDPRDRGKSGLVTRSVTATTGWMTLWAGLTGAIGAAATLVRPSWVLATPAIGLVMPLMVLVSRRVGRRVSLATVTLVMLMAFAGTLVPWWVRNWQVTGHFVPTTLWVGASLFDGWNERATGASNMEFMDRPEEYGLDPEMNSMGEWEQDQYLRREAIRFAQSHPQRASQLAAIKFARFWNPRPNAAEWSSGVMRAVSLLTVTPVLALIGFGAWRLRRRALVVALLTLPVLYFSVVHLVFVSSVRYREAALLPAFGLAAAALLPRRMASPTAGHAVESSTNKPA
jgi:4-amino-4-deoxy-L-arabinose transferase-like glycosyltransferase